MKISYYPMGDYRTNCILLSDEQGHLAVIDPGDDVAFVLSLVKQHGGKVDMILLTHAHFDHMLSARELQEATRAPLYLHEADESALSDYSRSLIPEHRRPYVLTADRALKDGDTLSLGSLTLTVLHTPGHTPGCCCYLCDTVLFSGDTLFAGCIGRTDLVGSSMIQMLHSLRRLKSLAPEIRVIPGHGEETTIGHECRFNPFLSGV